MERSTERLVEEFLNELVKAGDVGDVVDFQHVFASPLPAVVIAQLMGVPQEDRVQFKAWSDDVMPLVFVASEVPIGGLGVNKPSPTSRPTSQP